MSKIFGDAASVLSGLLRDDMTIAVGGFGLSGNPAGFIETVHDSGVRDLTIMSNNMGTDGRDLCITVHGTFILGLPGERERDDRVRPGGEPALALGVGRGAVPGELGPRRSWARWTSSTSASTSSGPGRSPRCPQSWSDTIGRRLREGFEFVQFFGRRTRGQLTRAER